MAGETKVARYDTTNFGSYSDTTGLITEHAVDTSLFPTDLDRDLICGICLCVPKRPATPSCCGKIFCRECLLKAIREKPACPVCRSPCTLTEVLASPYARTRLSGMEVKCPYLLTFRDENIASTNATAVLQEQSGSPLEGGETSATAQREQVDNDGKKAAGVSIGSMTTTMSPQPLTQQSLTQPLPHKACSGIQFGREGVRLVEHIVSCPFFPVQCIDCGFKTIRGNMLAHRPLGAAPCPHATSTCPICNVVVSGTDRGAHDSSQEHADKAVLYANTLMNHLERLRRLLKKVKDHYQNASQNLVKLRQDRTSLSEWRQTRMHGLELRMDRHLMDIRTAGSAIFLEFDVPNCSKLDKKVALFSMASPVKKWGRDWWLKVEKTDTYIGCYLCVGGEPGMTVDYRLLVRKRGTDEAAFWAPLFRKKFDDTNKAYGLPRFISFEHLKDTGAYKLPEDTVTFGCIVYPLENCTWGNSLFRAPPPPSVS